jgi:hypothetical protein
MKQSVHLFVIIAVCRVLSGCVHSPPLPVELVQLDPWQDCPHESRAGGWQIRAHLLENAGESYLAVVFNPGFVLQRPPMVSIKSGFAVLAEQRENRYYYRLGKLPNSRLIGKFSFNTPDRRNQMDEMITLTMERRKNSACVRFIEESDWRYR